MHISAAMWWTATPISNIQCPDTTPEHPQKKDSDWLWPRNVTAKPAREIPSPALYSPVVGEIGSGVHQAFKTSNKIKRLK